MVGEASEKMNNTNNTPIKSAEELARHEAELLQLSHQIINYSAPIAICQYAEASCRNKQKTTHLQPNGATTTARANTTGYGAHNSYNKNEQQQQQQAHHPTMTVPSREHIEAVDYITVYNLGDEKLKRCMAQLSVLDNWHKYPVVSIDGQNGTTKSTLAKSLRNRHLLKINDLMPDITSGSDYNHHVLKSLEYMYGQVCYQPHKNPDFSDKYIVWDRCCFSNMIFYFIHQLMAHYMHTTIPMDYRPVWQFLNMMAIDTNLMATINVLLQYQKQLQPNNVAAGKVSPSSCVGIPTLFLVCRNLDFVALTLRQRGLDTMSFNDIYNAAQYNYQMAQYYVYTWFSQLLNYPIFDITDFMEAGLTIPTIHMLIAQRLNPKSKVLIDKSAAADQQTTIPDALSSNQRSLTEFHQYDNGNHAKDILDYCNAFDNTMIYDFSKK